MLKPCEIFFLIFQQRERKRKHCSCTKLVACKTLLPTKLHRSCMMSCKMLAVQLEQWRQKPDLGPSLALCYWLAPCQCTDDKAYAPKWTCTGRVIFGRMGPKCTVSWPLALIPIRRTLIFSCRVRLGADFASAHTAVGHGPLNSAHAPQHRKQLTFFVYGHFLPPLCCFALQVLPYSNQPSCWFTHLTRMFTSRSQISLFYPV